MKLDKATVSNFRGIRAGSVSFSNYGLIIGPNNAGKTSFIDAIRCFYEKDGYKFKGDRDLPFGESSRGLESWIELEFTLSDSEFDSLSSDYKGVKNLLTVRKYFQTTIRGSDGKALNGVIVGKLATGSFSDSHFYGAKNVQNGKFGELVYIPAVSKVDDHTKLTGPSSLRDLVTSILQDVVESSKSFGKFVEDFGEFASKIKTEKSDAGASLETLEDELSDMMGGWSTEFRLNINPPTTNEIIKSLVTYDFLDPVHGKALTADQYGSGFQRQFIFSLIQLGAKYASDVAAPAKKEFSPKFTLILFEEPEAFLHPPQQEILARSLYELTQAGSRQVFCSSHSSHFVSKNADDLKSLVRVRRDKGVVTFYQINDSDWTEIVGSNQDLSTISQKWKKLAEHLSDDDTKADMEAVKYLLWLNPDRCSLFFADLVLLVEGATEAGFVNRLLASGSLNIKRKGIYVLDCIGKFNIHRFISLLTKLGIEHSVLFDDDKNHEHHKDINDMIIQKRTPMTKAVEVIEGDVEEFLGIKDTSKHRKPQHLLYKFETGGIDQGKVNAFNAVLEKLIT